MVFIEFVFLAESDPEGDDDSDMMLFKTREIASKARIVDDNNRVF